MTDSSLNMYNSLETAVARAAVPTVRNPVLVINEFPGRASMRAAARDFGSGATSSVLGAVTFEALLSSLLVDWKRNPAMDGVLSLSNNSRSTGNYNRTAGAATGR